MQSKPSNYKSPFGLDKEMGYTHSEFVKLLPRCLSGYKYSISNELVHITVPSGRVEIHIGVEGERVFTELVKFPILPIQIKFIEVSESDRSDFLRRFDQSIMKGLG